jgi:hypothetical protein
MGCLPLSRKSVWHKPDSQHRDHSGMATQWQHPFHCPHQRQVCVLDIGPDGRDSTE